MKRLPGDLSAALTQDWNAAIEPLKAASSLYVIGRGPGLAIAQEAALKLKETSGLHAEAISAAELMHGHLTLTGSGFPVLAFSQNDDSLPGMRDVVGVLVARGVRVIVAGSASVPGAIQLPIAHGLSPLAQPIALVQSFYTFADALARVRGRDPDRPPHLVKVTETI